MRKFGGCLTLIVFLIGAYFFVQLWRSTMPRGIGTGLIRASSDDLPKRDKRTAATRGRLALIQVVENPGRFADKTVSVTGRVRGAGRLASNRNIYRLTDGQYRLIVIDDKAPPKEFELRTVSGKVKLLKPPLGNASYAYLVSVKEGVKFDELAWNEAKGWFTGTYKDVKKNVKGLVREW
jgi:hypothetical protein